MFWQETKSVYLVQQQTGFADPYSQQLSYVHLF